MTIIRTKMNNLLISLPHKIIPRKRALVKSVIDELKTICQIEYSRHSSLKNFIVNLNSGLLAYSFLKPLIQFEVVKSDQLSVILLTLCRTQVNVMVTSR